jgi:hypothetical protein
VRIFVLIAAISCAYGQTAQLSGVVRDPSQAVVGGVSIAVRNDETQVERVAVTNSEGVYDVPFWAWQLYHYSPGSGIRLDLIEVLPIDGRLSVAHRPDAWSSDDQGGFGRAGTIQRERERSNANSVTIDGISAKYWNERRSLPC